ncbi:undecaprenyldiphospho-muramoylpentapeptide beta-N-acetylglucosaminyltransferase [Chromatiales bacterium (ex Bugula neritina AB1)]|nr:undecaprenyldiphospho-muramoylpentapeptide beta-N-acetylglucosaminyltransferase [Chromatiales bacterium (ex Bugula neritina AB1)]
MTDQPVMIAAGGTGGHVFPALAVASALREKNIPVIWVGTDQGIESRLVPDSGYTLKTITVTALRGRGLLKRAQGLLNLARALCKSVSLIRQVQPRTVLGMGGYVSGPVCLAARLCGRRMVLHEQNGVAGFTNKMLKRFASSIMEAMPGTFNAAFTVVHTGNPVRTDILNIAPPGERMAGRGATRRILVVGGSQGAKALNEIVPASLALVEEPLEIRHQSGDRWVAETQRAYAHCGHAVEVFPFIDNMAEAFEWADLIVCRSGAMTVAEIAAVGIASILVPFPSAVDDHQTVNGQYLVDNGAAVMQQESDMTVQSLATEISAIVNTRETLIEMAQNARKVSRRDATQRVVNNLLEVD